MTEEHATLVQVRVKLFGECEVEYREEEGTWKTVLPQEWGGTTHSRRLLAFLLLHERSADRATLMEQLWPESESVCLEGSLNKAVSNLRRVLRQDGLLTMNSKRTIYRLANQSQIWADVDAVLAALQEAEQMAPEAPDRCRLLEMAQGSFERGRLLDGEEDEWCHAHRQRLSTAHYRCLLWLAEAYEAQGSFRQAEAQIERLLQKNPLDEMALSRLMRLLRRQGLAAEALRRYRSTVSLLKKQGISPSSDIENLAYQLMQYPSLDEKMQRSGQERQALAEMQARSDLPVPTVFRLETNVHTEVSSRMLEPRNSPFSDGLLETYAQGIAACQDLYFGGCPHEVEKILPLYCNQTASLSQQSSNLRKPAARLASLSQQLLCELATDREDFHMAAQAARFAFLYGQLAEDKNLQVAALIGAANLGFHRKQSTVALRAYEQAVSLLDDSVTPLLRGRTYAGIAEVYAMRGQMQEALHAMGLAYEHYPLRPEDDPAYPYLRASRYALYVFGDAQSRLFLAQPKEADHALHVVQQETADVEREPVTKLDLLYYQAEVQYQQAELEASAALLQEASGLAKVLGSRLYFGKLTETYEAVRAKWPHERLVATLEEAFQPW